MKETMIEWNPGDIAYLAGCSKIKIVKIQQDDLKVEMIEPTVNSKYKKGQIFSMSRPFIHRKKHR